MANLGQYHSFCQQITSKDEEYEAGNSSTVNTICQEGICPLCGGEIVYGERDNNDTGGTIRWTCKDCGATGKEGYYRVFDGNHYNVQKANGAPVNIEAPDSSLLIKPPSGKYRIQIVSDDDCYYTVEFPGPVNSIDSWIKNHLKHVKRWDFICYEYL